MSASHYFKHLVKAYVHFHPIDEHKQFKEKYRIYEKRRLKEDLLAQLAAIESRCDASTYKSEDIHKLRERVIAIRNKVEVN